MFGKSLWNVRVFFGIVAICLVMLSGLAMPGAASAEQHGSSYGQRFCMLAGGTVIRDETFIEAGSYGTITCLLADGRTILQCGTAPGRLNDCHLRKPFAA